MKSNLFLKVFCFCVLWGALLFVGVTISWTAAALMLGAAILSAAFVALFFVDVEKAAFAEGYAQGSHTVTFDSPPPAGQTFAILTTIDESGFPRREFSRPIRVYDETDTVDYRADFSERWQAKWRSEWTAPNKVEVIEDSSLKPGEWYLRNRR